MAHLDEVHRLIQRWITGVNVQVFRKTEKRDEHIILTFRRCNWFRDHFEAKKQKVRKKRELARKIKERAEQELKKHDWLK